jgi:hypothetical protein
MGKAKISPQVSQLHDVQKDAPMAAKMRNPNPSVTPTPHLATAMLRQMAGKLDQNARRETARAQGMVRDGVGERGRVTMAVKARRVGAGGDGEHRHRQVSHHLPASLGLRLPGRAGHPRADKILLLPTCNNVPPPHTGSF